MNKYIKLLWILILSTTVFLPVNIFAYEGKANKYVLDNGLTVVISEMPSSPVVSIYALVKAGSATEGKLLGTGVSHFLEHMLFKGTESYQMGEIASTVQALGGDINASTSFDFTMYKITVPHEAFSTGLKIMNEMLFKATIPHDEFEKEREVIFGEMRLYNDNPDRIQSLMTFQTMYLNHPYRHPIIGYENLFGAVSRDELYDYYKTHYMPNNIIVSIAGNIKGEDILSEVTETFEKVARGKYEERNLPAVAQQITPRHYEDTYATDLARLSIAYPGVSLLDRDLYAMDVLAMILGQGESSRLYQDIYQKQKLVYQISSYNFTPVDRGLFEISCLLEEKNIETVKAEILKQVALIKEKGVDKEELERAKRQTLSGYVFANQTPASVASSRSLDEAFTGDYKFSENYVKAVENVSAEDIILAANRYLVDQAENVIILKPQNKEAAPSLETASSTSNKVVEDIQKVILDNGLTVLLREDHDFPLVSLRLNLRGGLREENDEINGVTELMADAWIKGTKSKTAKEISALTEGLGMSLNSFAGKNSFGLTLDFLSQDIDTALNLLEDVVKNPVFPSDEIAQIKEDMSASLRERDFDISRNSGFQLRQLLFEKHPFRLYEGGSKESILRLSQKTCEQQYQKFLTPNNMVLSVFGDINAQEVLKQIKVKFKTIKKKEMKLARNYEPDINSPREKSIFMDKQQAMVLVGFHAPSMFDQDRYGVEVLTTLIGSSFSGRLFTKIREDLGRAYTLGGFYVPGIELGYSYFYVLTTDENVIKSKEIILQEIKKLQNELISDQELKDIKTYLKGNFKSDLQTNASLSFASGLDELYGLGYLAYQDFDQKIDQVTKEDIQRLAKEYLDLNKYAAVITRPIKKTEVVQP